MGKITKKVNVTFNENLYADFKIDILKNGTVVKITHFPNPATHLPVFAEYFDYRKNGTRYLKR